ncbi:hypothetical protein B566_EDAN004935 [Ephemera danica]|nr:hypothetical protein B566_EDAN004935 [Ephemera danica]
MELKIARLTLLVATALAMPPRPDNGAGNSEKVEIHQVRCVPRLTVVPLPVEIAAHLTLYPDVALVKRCAGACHSGKTCMPQKKSIVEIKVLEYNFLENIPRQLVRSIEVEQHDTCKCTCKTQAADCTAKQSYDGCRCKCTTKGQCQSPQVWKEDTCSCECPVEAICHKGTIFNKEQCKCVTKKRRKKA